MILSVTVEKFE